MFRRKMCNLLHNVQFEKCYYSEKLKNKGCQDTQISWLCGIVQIYLICKTCRIKYFTFQHLKALLWLDRK